MSDRITPGHIASELEELNRRIGAPRPLVKVFELGIHDGKSRCAIQFGHGVQPLGTRYFTRRDVYFQLRAMNEVLELAADDHGTQAYLLARMAEQGVA